MPANTRLFRNVFILGLASITLVACGNSSEKKAVEAKASSFIETYYAQDNVAKSIQYTSGPLKEKLSKQVASIKASGVIEPASERPKLSVHKKTISKYTDTTYAMTWTLQSSEGEHLKADLQLEETDSNWYVTSLIEDYK